MYTELIFSTLSAISFAAPLVKRADGVAFQPAPGSQTTCDTNSDKIVGFYDGPQLETVVNDACAAMMAPCAYQERLAAGTACAQTTTWPLSEAVKSAQSADVETTDGNKIPGYQVQCKFSNMKLRSVFCLLIVLVVAATPAPQPSDSAGVFWSRDECYGYFSHMLSKQESEGGCHTEKGFAIGKITAGGDSSLKDTVFEVTIVPAQ
jgi:hypothetical protein